MPNTLFPTADDVTRERFAQSPTLALLNRFDWSTTGLGPIASWPETLRGAVRMMMLAKVPMVMLAGETDGTLIYNDGYAVFAGDRHPAIFGQPALEAWPEIADFNRENMRRGFAGETWHLSSQELVLDRGQGPASAFIDLSYSPVTGEDGRPLALLVIVQETTERVLVERALLTSEERRELALSGGAIVGTWDWDILADRVTADDEFARLYTIDPSEAARGVAIEQFVAGIYPAHRERVAREIQHAIDFHEDYRSEYRLATADGSALWVAASGRPRFDEQGRAVRFPGVAVDITAEKLAASALAESELRFRTLADTMPQMVWSTLSDGYVDYYNARWYEFTGVPEGATDGGAWDAVVHPDDMERTGRTWKHSLDTGEPYQIEYRLRHNSGEYRWVLGQALPIRDPIGRIVRWFGSGTDIHEAKLAAEEREVVAQELSHRIKNIFAVIGGIVALAARTYPEASGLATELRARIISLGKAHDFVRPHSAASAHRNNPSSLRQLIGELMSPYKLPGDDRVEVSGDDAVIDEGAATPLALIFHELGTNAAKYGALSKPGGRVAIEISRSGETCRVTWREIGGTPGPLSDKQGFGSRLIALSVEGQLRGRMTRTWEPGGLVAELEMPLASLSRKATLQA